MISKVKFSLQGVPKLMNLRQAASDTPCGWAPGVGGRTISTYTADRGLPPPVAPSGAVYVSIFFFLKVGARSAPNGSKKSLGGPGPPRGDKFIDFWVARRSAPGRLPGKAPGKYFGSFFGHAAWGAQKPHRSDTSYNCLTC